MATGTHADPRFVADPREGTVAGPGGTVRLEPKVMEVLTVLSGHAGQVVPRDELIERVWPDVIVTEHTLSRCIYCLRRDLGKIGGGPASDEYNPIETLPKRGYRLLPAVEMRSSYLAAPAYAPAAPAIPFVVGQWVRGERFYGRAAQIAEILDGHRDCMWLLGTRRIGKTSLLKQIELVSATDPRRRYFPIFWDFQGVDNADELHLNFADALLDAEERLEGIGIELQDVAADDLFVSLDKLRRRLRGDSLSLLLLCDEVEELIRLQQEQPSLLRKLRHAMQSREGIRTVLASTIRLWALAEHREDTSPFLHGFTPPLFVARLTDEEARSLIEQSHLGPTERPRYDAGAIQTIREHCDNHPYLVQLVCKRYAESGSLEGAIEQVATDRMVSYFFSVDFEMLSRAEQQIVRLLTDGTGTSVTAIREEVALGEDALQDILRRLEHLAFIRQDSGGHYALPNYFFRRWLQGMSQITEGTEAVRPEPAATADSGAVPDAEVVPQEGLINELKQRNVFRAGAAYIVVAWLLLQVGEIVFDFLEVPAWAGKLLLAFLVLGLPLVLILAWAFELTPDGLKRESDLDRSVKPAKAASRKLEIVVLSILAVVAVLLALYRFL